MSLAISFHEEGPKDGQEHVLKRFEEYGVNIIRNEKVPHIVLTSVSEESLEREAERIDLLKITKKGQVRNFQRANATEFDGFGSKTFFTPSERNLLLANILDHVTTDAKFAKFDTNDQISEGAELIDAAKCVGIIHCVFPPHDQILLKKLFDKAIRAWPCDASVVHDIKAYFGSEVAMYFAFMDHFASWLIPPAIFGLAIALWNYIDLSVDVDNNLVIPLFSVFVIGWGVLFVKYWRQTSSGFACTWGTIGRTGRDVSRFDFKGEIAVSKVTGLKERKYSWYRRIPYYLLSALVTGCMLLVAFAVMVMSLNLQGYIRADAMGARYLHYPVVSQYSEPGKWFDNLGGGPYPLFLPLVPVVLHALVIMHINSLYRVIAEWLTKMENHRTDQDFNNSLIVKRILFESFDCYIALFYLAFVKFDIAALRNDFVGLYTTDSLRRLATESVLPWLINKWEARSAGVAPDEMEDDKNLKSASATDKVAVLLKREFLLDEYDTFDDYLEMVISFGYIALFAGAFPLASALTVICVVIEVRSDLFKLCWVCRRPIPQQVQDIGTWETVLEVMAWTSIITNCFIFAFTTEQMMQVFPSFFNVMQVVSMSGNDRQHIMAAGMGRYVWAGVMFIEHILFILAAAVSALIPSRPEWVKDEIKRLSFAKAQESKQLHRLRLHRSVSQEAAAAVAAADTTTAQHTNARADNALKPLSAKKRNKRKK